MTSASDWRLQKLRFSPLLRRAGREMTVGILRFGAASPKALNSPTFRNITEQRFLPCSKVRKSNSRVS